VPIFCNPIAANTASSFWGLIDVYFIKKIYLTLDELQKDLDDWVVDYNTRRSHQGKRCQGKTPMAPFLENVL
jgi:hypothetical protein